ncbi:hypothetical protein C8D77_10412 [Mesorhizobium loti]|uniref:Uncharacterized protein n=1 Tax=Rhizobium loti TaxID=381 RepID=A0A8E2WDW8_RHILI|nr:hypothetical protein C8D77_10412 [Mesorhizobium loti]
MRFSRENRFTLFLELLWQASGPLGSGEPAAVIRMQHYSATRPADGQRPYNFFS